MGKDKLVMPEHIVYVCVGSKCKGKLKTAFLKPFESALKKSEYKKEVKIIKTACTGNCKHAPVVCLQPENKWYSQSDGSTVEKIFKKIKKRKVKAEKDCE
ncbi:(2Fe-2S) ferredoxin domain-containing protein [Aureibacter tunicatorum]|uniref:NADH:ubiquinone oxidoreductase subunit E n=1 Tax=Aureibacter tunicatorum TaxID=866807 RepID=A0AAE4BT43_9BACT|nr:(2Fe-2S) ferredoxin domain-containing protein [Aureibacter tunicatorum]MDR6239575.1 NADH:ubiquinone oxidoreductase subunit E [Aureibacter tunicatorum]BDD04052.1 hypothetical protein AUTU_15350 [Aureibacter tunicatorum]